MKIGIFLGAGASSVDGAPLQNEIFRDYFKSKIKTEKTEIDDDLAVFFENVFDIQVFNDDLDRVFFPTFEEVLGVLDLARIRKESLKLYDLNQLKSQNFRISEIKQHLIFLMARVIYNKLKESKENHKRLVNNLKVGGQLNDTLFISTNYDLLIDNALEDLCDGTIIDYGFDFINQVTGRKEDRCNNKKIELYKVHGSLNWLYCPTCNNVKLTPKMKSVIYLSDDPSFFECDYCNSSYTPVIVPPTFFKDMSNVFLSLLWQKAETSLREIEHLVFCGYSFPDADIHIKYLIKRIQTNRGTTPIKFHVINYYQGKDEDNFNDEKNRYERFLGHKNVEFKKISFECFVNNPLSIINHHN